MEAARCGLIEQIDAKPLSVATNEPA